MQQRAFGTVEDLDLDFASADRQQLVSQLLAYCSTPDDAAFWQAQSASARTLALLELAADSAGLGVLPVKARCSQCSADYEFSLPLHALFTEPQATLEVTGHCPACGAEQNLGNDLEAAALALLQNRQHALLLTIHQLASHYGWSEAQVLAIPAWRRAYYLGLIKQTT